MSIVYYARKKEIQEIVEKLDYRNKEIDIKKSIQNLIATNLYAKEDEDIQDTLNNCIDRFISLMELELTGNDIEICSITSQKVYWSNEYGFYDLSHFIKIWNEEYSKDYLIISEECEIITIENLIKMIKKRIDK